MLTIFLLSAYTTSLLSAYNISAQCLLKPCSVLTISLVSAPILQVHQYTYICIIHYYLPCAETDKRFCYYYYYYISFYTSVHPCSVLTLYNCSVLTISLISAYYSISMLSAYYISFFYYILLTAVEEKRSLHFMDNN